MGEDIDLGMYTILFAIDGSVTALQPPGPLLFLVGIVGEDELDAGSKLTNVLWCDRLGSKPGTRFGGFVFSLFWLVSR